MRQLGLRFLCFSMCLVSVSLFPGPQLNAQLTNDTNLDGNLGVNDRFTDRQLENELEVFNDSISGDSFDDGISSLALTYRDRFHFDSSNYPSARFTLRPQFSPANRGILNPGFQNSRGLFSLELKRINDFPETDPYSYDYYGYFFCLLYTSPSPRDQRGSRMPSSA